MEAEYKYMVATICKTFNHAPYIEDTLNGFILQKTDFPCVYIIIDDASLDGEPDILRSWAKDHLVLAEGTENHEHLPYGERFTAPLKDNKNAFFVIVLLSVNHHGKKSKMPYVAEWFNDAKYLSICEGDDFWINPHKLQMQVDFLENNHDYCLCHTDFDSSSGPRRHYKEKYLDGNYFPSIITRDDCGIGTLTVMYRLSSFNLTPQIYNSVRFVADDKAMWIELASIAKVKYFPVVTGVYRVLSSSASHFDSAEKVLAFRRGLLNIRKYYANYFGLNITDFSSYYTNCIRDCYIYQDSQSAKQLIFEARANNSLTLRGVLFYIGTRHRIASFFINLLHRPH